MTKTDREDMMQVPRQALEDALQIVAEMRSLVDSEMREKHNVLLMSSSFEDLEAAQGLLAGCLDPGKAGLVVSSRDTRIRLRTAYSNIDAVLPNAVDGSPAQAACMQLEAALFSILNMHYENGSSQAALEKAMTAAKFGRDLCDGLLEAGGEASLDDCYLNKGGQLLTDERLGMARDVLSSLLPEAAPPEGRENEKEGAEEDA